MLWKRHLGKPTPQQSPNYIILTDREDGKLWALWHRVSDDRLGITDTLPGDWNAGNTRTFTANEGPVLVGRPRVRLFVRSGRLGMEVLDPLPRQYASDIDQLRIMSRIGNQRYALEAEGKKWSSAGILGWRTFEGDYT